MNREDNNGKIVANPKIGYGLQTLKNANGKTNAFNQIGINPKTTGISV